MRRSACVCALLVLLVVQLAVVFALPSNHHHTYSRKRAQHRTSALIASSQDASISATQKRHYFPCGDSLDKSIISLALPAILNFAIIPLVGAVDTFFVGQMKQPLALAGQGAANQVFSSAFWIISFLPSVITPLVAKAAGAGDTEAVQDHVGEAMFIATIMGVIGMIALYAFPERALSTVFTSADAPARAFATPYLNIRALTFLPAILSTVGFATFRGTMNIMVPLRISLVSNLINCILDPILIFKAGMGVAGAAAATCVAEIVSLICYVQQMRASNVLRLRKLLRVPSFAQLKPLLFGGFIIQLRAIAMNVAFISVTRATQGMDSTGVAAAAHAITIQLWQLGGVFLLAMGTVASIMVPTEVAKAARERKSLLQAKQTADRLLVWGGVLGVMLGGLQLLCLPLLATFSRGMPEVQAAARLPSIIGAGLQLINGFVFIGEGIQTGNQAFFPLAVCTGLATAGMLTTLRFYGNSLAGVWGGFAVFNTIRLLGVLRHHFLTGPFVTDKLDVYEVKRSALKKEIEEVE